MRSKAQPGGYPPQRLPAQRTVDDSALSIGYASLRQLGERGRVTLNISDSGRRFPRNCDRRPIVGVVGLRFKSLTYDMTPEQRKLL